MNFKNRIRGWFHKKDDRGAHKAASNNAQSPNEPPAGKALVPEVIRPEVYVGDDTAKNEQTVREGFVSKAKRYLRHIPLASEVVAMYFCMLDARTPLWVKGTVAAALAYFILPADAVPDLLPVVGLSDDVGVLTAAITAVSAHITADHRRQAHEWMEVEDLADLASEPASS